MCVLIRNLFKGILEIAAGFIKILWSYFSSPPPPPNITRAGGAEQKEDMQNRRGKCSHSNFAEVQKANVYLNTKG